MYCLYCTTQVTDLYRGGDLVCVDEEWLLGVRLFRFMPVSLCCLCFCLPAHLPAGPMLHLAVLRLLLLQCCKYHSVSTPTSTTCRPPPTSFQWCADPAPDPDAARRTPCKSNLTPATTSTLLAS